MNQLEILLKLKNETQAGFAQLEKAVDGVKKQTADLSAAQTSSAAAGLKFGAAIGVGFAAINQILPALTKVVGVMNDSVRAYASAGSELVDLKNKLGVGVVEMQKMQFAAKQTGVDFGSLTTSLAMMERIASKTPEKFAQLGISFGQIRSSSPDQLMRLISDGLQNVSDHNERARISTELFGRSGTEMLKMLSGGYRDLLKEAESTGLMTEEMALKGDRLDDVLAKLDSTTKNLQINLAEAFSSPEMIRFMGQMADLIGLMARNAEKVAFALKTIAMSGTNLGGDGLKWLFGGSAAEDSGAPSSVSPSGNVNQYQPGKGAGAVTKGLSKLDAAFDKLLARMGRDAEKAAKETEKSADKFAGFMDDYAREFSLIPQGAAALARAVRESIIDGAARAGYAPGIATDFGGVTNVSATAGNIPLQMPGIATSISDATAEYWKNAPITPDEMKMIADQQEKARESAARWAGALQGVALIAGAIGGKLGETIGVIGNLGRAFEGWDKMGKNEKFNAIAGGVGQIGGLMGGTGGAALQGAAGGAMAGFQIGGPVGAAIGGVAGGILGIFGASAAKKKEVAELKGQLEGMRATATRLGIDLTKTFSSKEPAQLKAAIDQVNKAMEAQQKRTAGLAMAAGGLNSFVGGGGVTDQASANRSSLYATAIFGGMVKDTGDVAAALQAISPALSELAKKADEMGLSLGAGVSNLIGMSNVLSANEGLAGQVSGLNQMMKGLADAGMMNKDMFSALGADATAVFNQLIAGGASGNQALALMQPTLQQLYEGQKLHGYAVDENTQKLLDEAKAQGIVGDAFMSANERMVELLAILVETVGGKLPDAYKRAGDAAEDYGRRATSSMPTAPGGPAGDDGRDAGFASGTAFRDFGAGTRTTLHGKEAVMTPAQVDRLVSMAVSGAPGSTVPQGGGQPIVVHVVVDGEVLGTAMARTIQRRGPAGQAIRTELGGPR